MKAYEKTSKDDQQRRVAIQSLARQSTTHTESISFKDNRRVANAQHALQNRLYESPSMVASADAE